MPPHRNFLIAAGLQQAVEFLLDFQFGQEEIEYLRGLPQFECVPAEFFEFLRELRFTGDLFAVPEGTPIFASEPLAIIRAPLVQAQLVETYLLSTFAFQTIVASKAARCVLAAGDREVVEFGSRRAHSPEAGIFAGRAGYIGGCSGTSNAEAGHAFRHSGVRHRGAFLDHVISERGRIISGTATGAGWPFGFSDRHL